MHLFTDGNLKAETLWEARYTDGSITVNGILRKEECKVVDWVQL
jgi:hypothetical protein